MKKLNIEYKKEALKFLFKNDRLLQKKIEEKLNDYYIFWEKNVDIKELSPKGNNLYRLRLWKFRIIFSNINNELIIIILRIGSRWDIYK